MNYTNIITIYERLYRASDNIQGETIDFIRGFQACVYLLCRELKKLPHINLHIENRYLKRQLYLAELRLDDNAEDKSVVFRRNSELAAENKQLKKDLMALRSVTKARAKTAIAFNPVEIEYGKQVIKFFTSADSDTFMKIFEKATNSVNHSVSKFKRTPTEADLKNLYMTFYRDAGFKCSAK